MIFQSHCHLSQWRSAITMLFPPQKPVTERFAGVTLPDRLPGAAPFCSGGKKGEIWAMPFCGFSRIRSPEAAPRVPPPLERSGWSPADQQGSEATWPVAGAGSPGDARLSGMPWSAPGGAGGTTGGEYSRARGNACGTQALPWKNIQGPAALLEESSWCPLRTV